jgi:catechol 2,3-dioxygenase-like lactoylglutathione lyase family enzyme
MAMRLENVTIDARDPAALGRFWADVLGYRTRIYDDGEIDVVPPVDDPIAGYPELVFGYDANPGAGRIRIHLDLATESVEHQQRWVSELLAMGATHGDVGQPADSPFTVLADPEGNPFCVLDPRPEYGEPGQIASIVLAAHDAAALRDVYVEATGWTLVRDDPDFISLQRPDGRGPLLEILTRPTMPAETAKNRIHLDVAPSADEDQTQASAVLCELGCRPVDIGQGPDVSWLVLADPEDNELCVLTPRD